MGDGRGIEAPGSAGAALKDGPVSPNGFGPLSHDIPGTLLLDPAVIDDPYPFYRQLREHAPVWRVPGRDVFIVTSFALLAEAAARVEDFSSNMRALLYRDEEGLPGRLSFGDAGIDALATADPPLHKSHRNVVFSELVAKRMAALEPEIVEIATRCLAEALDLGSLDFMSVVGNVVPITLISQLIGFPDGDPDYLLQAAFDSTTLLGGTLPLSELEKLVTRSAEIEAWIADHLTVAARQPADDILGAIARGIEADALGAHEGCIILHTLLSAGGESTTSLLGNAVRLLAEKQELQQDLRRRPELVPAFIEEVLRLESPFRFLMRFVPESTTLGGVDVPAGNTVLLFWGAANRDPAEFEDPDEVILDRRVPRRHVAFGRGIHHCVGAPLARLEARTVLTMVLEQTSNISLDPEQPPRRVESLMVRRHEQLPIQVG
jgi:cytochrome P450